MTLLKLPPASTREFGITHKAIFDATDVAALGGAATGNFQIAPKTGNFSPGTLVAVIATRLILAFDFSDAAINSLALTIGDAGSNNRLLTSQELSVDGAAVTYKAGTLAPGFLITSSQPVTAYFTAAGGGTPTLAECTLGKVEVYLYVADFSALSRVVAN
jgi:hypothetical protein